MHKAEIYFNDSSSINGYYLDIETPNHCPHCHTKIFPVVIGHSDITETETFPIFTVIFLCPSCKNHFVETYNKIKDKTFSIGYKPSNTIDEEVPSKIKDFFPRFYNIYSQALTAESYGLEELIGIGFRKSIEFLIKDFLIEIKKFSVDEISEMSLQNAINKIDDIKTKTLATKIYWLGNDETHYQKKHEDRNYTDMKIFIKLLYSYINSELTYLDAESIEKK
ncbi:hypothetical protein [uncultured Fusobacterium sp.]|uniref:hypothetical protein n=1 Tax=uncultured Fusobacterium sp. TaxID=159267 RepID=UPI0025DCE692|nr:hypothetical protein [uncultured Fusobacterium sp.]